MHHLQSCAVHMSCKGRGWGSGTRWYELLVHWLCCPCLPVFICCLYLSAADLLIIRMMRNFILLHGQPSALSGSEMSLCLFCLRHINFTTRLRRDGCPVPQHHIQIGQHRRKRALPGWTPFFGSSAFSAGDPIHVLLSLSDQGTSRA